MQVAATQASRALAVLHAGRARGAARRRRRARARPVRAVAPTTLERAFDHIDTQPRVRRDRVAAARSRLVAGRHPGADEVAEMMIRRTICDALARL